MMDSSQSHLHRKPLAVRTVEYSWLRICIVVFATQAMHDAHVCGYVMWDRKEKLGHKDKAWVMEVEVFLPS